MFVMGNVFVELDLNKRIRKLGDQWGTPDTLVEILSKWLCRLGGQICRWSFFQPSSGIAVRCSFPLCISVSK